LGLPVVRIIRLRIGTLRLDNLKPRQWRYLTEDEVADLKGEKGKMIAKVRPKRRHPTYKLKRAPREKTKFGENQKPSTKSRKWKDKSN
jgi:23S rRNA pseudouridine2605 synthase